MAPMCCGSEWAKNFLQILGVGVRAVGGPNETKRPDG
jgi:hypothetical protein